MANGLREEAAEVKFKDTNISWINGVPGGTLLTDTAWNARGSGKGHNSPGGVSILIGVHRKKIVAFDLLNKVNFYLPQPCWIHPHSFLLQHCRICEAAKRQKKSPDTHSCTCNHTGSSKSMEAEGLVNVVSMVNNSKVMYVAKLVGDGDADGMAKLKARLSQP
jgi:hypothetical protein